MKPPGHPQPIVTLTTDFGSSDGYVAAMKGVILSLCPGVQLVDVTHGIAAQDVAAGAVALAQAASTFPPGTIHVAVVDPGVGGGRADLVVEAAGAIFVGPDNGLLSMAARAPRRAFRIAVAPFVRDRVSPTFHGRDIFAPTAGHLAAGASVEAVGPLVDAIVELHAPTVRRIDGRAEGTVTYVDGFGNLVTSLTGDLIEADHMVELEASDSRWHPARGRTFADVEPGALVAYVGSTGQLEIAVRNGSAARMTGAQRGSLVRLRRGP